MLLTLWRDISPIGQPLRRPTDRSPHVLVIGGGVIGLISWVLLDRGYRVTILSSAWTSDEQRLTSQIAGALWEFLPGVCGQHTDNISLAHSKHWAMTSYHMNEITASGVRCFHQGADIIKKRGINLLYGAVDVHELLAPVIGTDKAMGWLMELVRNKGANLVTETIRDSLVDMEDELRTRFGADVIVNATGLQGQVLAGDESVYPIRGGLIRVINDGSDFPKVDAALIITADAAQSLNKIIFLMPRNDHILLIGGINEPHEWNLDLTLDTAIVRRTRERCEKFLPELERARLDPDYPFAQGLRPFRGQNVRVERELRRASSRIVHSYGHGGSGWSLSFGCAQDVALLVDEVLGGAPAKPMSEVAREWKAAEAWGRTIIYLVYTQ
ncbi:FAD dependent oxidoreductase [Hypoxylon rubiginosum]|uniref:FAD dependent oxidoreductase n=1 Tax=Hypoxylon rubiginosum TaxID=110542 RepID=A0ACC0CI35_9PEZI|nr:FAD dependent oxidoreductase [Hypoxylon rubiginosum]